ncbi:hypothetical protein [Porphyromonas sp.]|uniref:hypothetical protein n=1 Tax=Porphyromonas sp. TaxID=1924944 RepID=UPI0026DA705F|nr:hypothetical protein [Porphyromonas sp.]MDO4771391.1 hypothetical protein [Porphyromonas sp.]
MMYLLTFVQNGHETRLALFDSMEAGQEFVRRIPGYKISEEVGEDYSFTYETFSPSALPEYMEIEQNGNRVPMSRFMFRDEDDVEIIWQELPDMAKPGQGLVDSQTLVDAYIIGNEGLEAYIAQRERNYERVKALLEGKGYETDRSFRGSEDGEAVIFRKRGEEDWHFLTHMDPSFVKEAPVEDAAFKTWIEEYL